MPREGRPVTVASREKARRAADMKIAGATWEQIAKEFGYKDPSGPRLLVMRYYAKEAKHQHDEMYPILHERGELMWKEAFRAIQEGKRTNNAGQWDRGMRHGATALNYLARINGLLEGPEVTVNVNTSRDVEALRQQFRQIEAAEAARAEHVVEGEVVDPDE